MGGDTRWQLLKEGTFIAGAVALVANWVMEMPLTGNMYMLLFSVNFLCTMVTASL